MFSQLFPLPIATIQGRNTKINLEEKSPGQNNAIIFQVNPCNIASVILCSLTGVVEVNVT